MKYNTQTNEYIIGGLKVIKDIDTSKMNDGVTLFSSNTWVSKKKDPLIQFAEEHKEMKINECIAQLEKIKNRTITEKKKEYKM
jgi:hypothetical protein